MAKTLHALIRLHQYRVDEKHREIGGIISVITDLERQTSELEKQISEEKAIAVTSPEEAGVLFGNYVAHCILKKEQFSVAIFEMEKKLAATQEEIREEYKDLKGIVLTQEERDKLVAIEQAKAEQAVLDEIGMQMFRRTGD